MNRHVVSTASIPAAGAYDRNPGRCVRSDGSSRRSGVLALLTDQQQVAKRACLARRLAPVLMQMLDIPPQECTVAAWLTDAGCGCNAEAVCAWTQRQLEDATANGACNPEELLITLASRLQRRLLAISDALS